MSRSINVLAIGDLHLHNWGYQELNLFQERLLQEIIPEKVTEFEANIVVFMGDIFHIKKMADRRLLNLLADTIKRISAYRKVYILTGNHDLYEGEPVLDYLEVNSNVKIISEMTTENWNGTQLMFIPYHHPELGEDGYYPLERFVIHNTVSEKTPLIVFSHVDIDGIAYDSNYMPPENKIHVRFNKIREVFPKREIYWINGHYHTPRAYPDHHKVFLINTGNCFPFTASEERQAKAFTTLEIDREFGIRVNVTPIGAPVLVVARSRKEYEELKKLDSKNFVVMYRPSPSDSVDPVHKTSDNSKEVDIMGLVIDGMKRRAKELGIEDTSFGEKLIREAVS